ncbi:MAG TPA: DUF167 domain-containing protein [Candidatus Hydrogenedentes bacterium]|nr:DUF167 domain-containing protein [Candidatus Hydrogenedentota bacterium]HOK90629.1 DUF167 domain-containing protein [Candidatus Hydrogenedentota bacterium]
MLTGRGSDVLLNVRVQPKSSRDAVESEATGRVRVRVTAPPEDNAANEAVVRLIARAVGVPACRVSIERGARGREKVLRIQGISVEQVTAILKLDQGD